MSLLALSAMNWMASKKPEPPPAVKILKLDGTPDSWNHCEVSYIPSWYDGLTVSFWMKLEKKPTSGTMRSAVPFSFLAYDEMGPIIDVNTNAESVGMMAGIQNVGWTSRHYTDYVSDFVHVAYTMRDGGQVALWVNGVMVEEAWLYFWGDSYGTISLGGQYYQGTLYDVPKGEFANVLVYERSLSDEEIQYLASGMDKAVDGAAHAWTFDQVDTVIHDTGTVGGWDLIKGNSAIVI